MFTLSRAAAWSRGFHDERGAEVQLQSKHSSDCEATAERADVPLR